jgi:PBSX family phage portal protein
MSLNGADVVDFNSISNAANRQATDKVKKRRPGPEPELISAKEFVDTRKAKEAEEHEIEVRKANAASGKPSDYNALNDEPLSALLAAGKIIEPPFDMLTLAMLPEHSSELRPCIEAMETNIESYGHRFVSRLKKDEEADKAKSNDQQVKEASLELAKLQTFFAWCTTESFTQFRRKLRNDLESTGNYYYEVVRNKMGEIQSFVHIPSYQMRLAVQDDDSTPCTRRIIQFQSDGSTKLIEIEDRRRFRAFVQTRSIHRKTLHTLEGYKVRWFREFGDPRPLNKDTGDRGTASKPVPKRQQASEIIHFRLYSPRSPYGLPRYIGNLISIMGDRAAEEINYITFRNNNVPSMAILVSNGFLTQGTITRIKQFVESQIQGSDNYSKFLIVEAETPEEDGEDTTAHVKIEMKPLTEVQHKDALFQNYSEKNREKIRLSFRLPAMFIGQDAGYNRATAEAGRILADEQLFAPERDGFDDIINRFILPELGIRHYTFKSNSPNTTDNAQLVKILAGAEKTGGMTPRIARQVLQGILGRDLPEFEKDPKFQFNPDIPFSLTMADAVKNMADASEPGQQVTAIKNKVNVLKSMGIIDDQSEILDLGDNDTMSTIVEKLDALIEFSKAAQQAAQQN